MTEKILPLQARDGLESGHQGFAEAPKGYLYVYKASNFTASNFTVMDLVDACRC